MISSVTGIVVVMCLVVQAAASVLTLGSLGAIIIAQLAQCRQDYKMCILESTNSRASGIREYFLIC
jgi:hypothetical protein